MDRTIQIRRNKKITESLRELAVGESLILKGAGDSVRTIAYRMAREGYRFSLSKKGVANGFKIDRIG